MIGVVVPANLKYAPYVENYIHEMERNSIPYELLLWDRKNIELDAPTIFKAKQSCNRNTIMQKIRMYFEYITFVRKHIAQKKYKKLMVFTLAPAILLGDLLHNRYRNKYLLDVRDDTVLRKYLPKTIKRLAKEADVLVASSPLFSEWLSREATLCHNVDISLLKEEMSFIPCKKECSNICIVYAGMMREAAINQEFIDQCIDDESISFVFHGPMNEQLQSLADLQANNDRCLFPGIYEKKNIHSIYRESATLVSIIREETLQNAQAIPNKLYDAAIAGVPIVVLAHNKAVAKYAKEYYLGIVADSLNREELKKAVCMFDYEQYTSGRRRFLKQISQDMETWAKQTHAFAARE